MARPACITYHPEMISNQTMSAPIQDAVPDRRTVIAISLALACAFSVAYFALSPAIDYQHYDSLIYAHAG